MKLNAEIMTAYRRIRCMVTYKPPENIRRNVSGEGAGRDLRDSSPPKKPWTVSKKCVELKDLTENPRIESIERNKDC